MIRKAVAAHLAAPIALILALCVLGVSVFTAIGANTPAAQPNQLVDQVLRTGSVPAQYAVLIQAAGTQCPAAPAPIIAAQIKQESGFNPKAVSPAGAKGISQFLDGTWATWGQGGDVFDPTAAIPAQARYDCAIAAQLQPLQKAGKLGSATLTELMLAGYNAGPGAVIKYGGIPPYAETQNYVKAITSSAASFTDLTALTGLAEGGPFAQAEIAAAQRWLGTPYAWAGGTYTGPSVGQCIDGPTIQYNDCGHAGFDCSGLVALAVFQASAGRIKLSHYVPTQVSAGGGTPVTKADIQPGDVLAFNDPGSTFLHHTGIYVGVMNGHPTMINAPESGSVVRYDDLSSSYYQSEGWTIRRYG